MAPGELVVGTVANLRATKGYPDLMRAAREVVHNVPNVRFVAVGRGPLEAELRALGCELGLGDRFELLGHRPDAVQVMSAFDVFCLSSHMEGLGTSLLDAMCYGRAVVGTAAGGIPEAVEDGVTGRVVPAQQPEALAAALTEVLLDPARREAMGQAGRARFLARFTADRMVDATLGVYAEAA